MRALKIKNLEISDPSIKYKDNKLNPTVRGTMRAGQDGRTTYKRERQRTTRVIDVMSDM